MPKFTVIVRRPAHRVEEPEDELYVASVEAKSLKEAKELALYEAHAADVEDDEMEHQGKWDHRPDNSDGDTYRVAITIKGHPLYWFGWAL